MIIWIIVHWAGCGLRPDTNYLLGRTPMNIPTRSEYSPVPGHISDTTGTFCDQEGTMALNGRCPRNCQDEDHYANDGHPECDEPITMSEEKESP